MKPVLLHSVCPRRLLFNRPDDPKRLLPVEIQPNKALRPTQNPLEWTVHQRKQLVDARGQPLLKGDNFKRDDFKRDEFKRDDFKRLKGDFKVVKEDPKVDLEPEKSDKVVVRKGLTDHAPLVRAPPFRSFWDMLTRPFKSILESHRSPSVVIDKDTKAMLTDKKILLADKSLKSDAAKNFQLQKIKMGAKEAKEADLALKKQLEKEQQRLEKEQQHQEQLEKKRHREFLDEQVRESRDRKIAAQQETRARRKEEKDAKALDKSLARKHEVVAKTVKKTATKAEKQALKKLAKIDAEQRKAVRIAQNKLLAKKNVAKVSKEFEAKKRAVDADKHSEVLKKQIEAHIKLADEEDERFQRALEKENLREARKEAVKETVERVKEGVKEGVKDTSKRVTKKVARKKVKVTKKKASKKRQKLSMLSTSGSKRFHVPFWARITPFLTGFSEPMNRRQAAKLLNVSMFARQSTIDAAYKQLMARNHPDRAGSTYLASLIIAAKQIM